MRPARPERSRASLAISVAVHVVVITALATMTFRYPLEALLGLEPAQRITPESLHFVQTPPAAVGNGSQVGAPAKRGAPAPLVAPRFIPNTLPQPTAPGASGAVSGKAGGQGGARVGVATGVEPEPMDPRLYAPPIFVPVPKTPAQRIDSVVKDAFGVYYDSVVVAQEHPQRKPGDWTIDRDGQKWGWDQKGIHLGKFMIPNAVLAALPLKNVTNGTSPVEQREQAYIRQTVLEHAQQSVTEDAFRDAVRRIRERKERERKEQDKEKTVAADGKSG